MKEKIWLSSPHMGEEEQEYVQQAFETNWIAPLGPNVDGFEQDISAFTGAKHTAVLTSGTAALHLGLILLDVQPGDEVICSSFTFAASANPIRYQGATPIFIDSEPDTWNMDPELLRTAIEDRIEKGKKPKAIILVHLYGMPCKMDEIMDIAEEFGIPVLEDAAEALGSTYKGQSLGTFGKMGTLSFNGNKIITTSGGGALISDEEKLIEKARFLSTQARDDAPHYQHSQIGYNYRMSNVVAGIGRGQMQVLPKRVAQRRENYSFYKSRLSDIEGISFHEEPNPDMSTNRWLTTITVNPDETNGVSREDLRLALQEENIESRPLWKPMHQQPVFHSCPYYGNGVSDKLFNNGLCLPSGSNLTPADRERVVQTIVSVF
ncbi:aminotransferase class I/II-fold pyridoxal phosphate-dependent enzyme [Aliifodinibius salicampi]|uniref:Aminotransferase class I/II-fold pyridoxal phosphate-dependent enzyme n=1 Tax=Fodinibius salicampi TaxID=1920655 RepID=A0ABT3PYR1_9BACT|nr:aminotransferase class I/II-fold pyridoxal phosphate-dependent enzyme [Fodinibius salicampi]MCW9712997.1 aminotransferase class I/II-fold pyridoxal phosphate-dependent enzyme [Fodinibius salicampi]